MYWTASVINTEALQFLRNVCADSFNREFLCTYVNKITDNFLKIY